MLVVQKKKNLSFLQSLVATMGLSQIVTACGGGGGSAASSGTSATHPPQPTHPQRSHILNWKAQVHQTNSLARAMTQQRSLRVMAMTIS
jgi:hypothetical protein